MKERHKILFKQLETYREDVLFVLNGITPELAEIVPNYFHSNIRWTMGHIYLDQYLWIEALTKEKTEAPDVFRKWFGYGTKPDNFSEDTPSFAELKELLRQQPVRLKEIYGHRLEEEYPPTEMGMRTIEQVLIRTIFHEGMHLQAINDIKKCLQ
ncbi:DinB family protein [Cytobacillus oceanisediminis]|uniref:DinB family protein n=1 Tax=Cytobacillus oceanisediminis TaxID=665099 RepID=UPI001C2151B3|nr:DinB family protein [Cytobacillus oceanisediminis]MBU8772026.1 DinB family protein [Cytobacillus oceanisediminis]